MGDLVNRFRENPIIEPKHIWPSRPELIVESVLNPGVFVYGGRIGLVLRVCERPPQQEGWISFPVLDDDVNGGMRVFRVPTKDRNLRRKDPRVITYDGDAFTTSLSHLRLAWSDDGRRFEVEPKPAMIGATLLEMCGIEDCRVTYIDGQHVLTYNAVSPLGIGVGMASTRDWKTFTRHGMVLPPANQSAVLFDRKIDGDYVMLHRPSGVTLGGDYIWMARSKDLLHWGRHGCVLRPRKGMWDSERIGACSTPIHTPRGWLVLYYGSDHEYRHSLGAVLLGLEDPSLVVARSDAPIMQARELYEKLGFCGSVVFANGHVLRGDNLMLYYGAAESVVCGAELIVSDILHTL